MLAILTTLLALCAYANAACNQWNLLLETNAIGASPKSYSSEWECLIHCTLDSSCTGVDINENSNANYLCWFFNDDRVNNDKVGPGVKHARRPESCLAGAPDCATDWRFYENNHKLGATEKSQYTTVHDCLSACACDAGCAGVDINNDRPSGASLCWHHSASSEAGGLHQFNKLDHYVKVESNCD